MQFSPGPPIRRAPTIRVLGGGQNEENRQAVVNCAGILQSGQRVLDQNLDEDEALWRVNYRGTLLGCQVFGRVMATAGGGAILNVGSLASFAPLSLPAYTPGKHAVLASTEILAAELGPRGVRVNAVAPGYTLSDGLKARIAKGERNSDAIKATTALRRFVEPRDVAEAAMFLCSDRAASITGVTLPVDAGWLVQAPYAQYLQGNPIRPAPQPDWASETCPISDASTSTRASVMA